MVLNLKKYIQNFLIIIILVGILHFLFYNAFLEYFGISIRMFFQIYGFLIFLNLLNFIALQWLFTKWPKYTGFLFTALSMIKMAFCILFLLPYIFPSNNGSISIVFNFMTVYFISLIFEVVFIAKNIKNS